jgi:hypothetical protein
MLFGAGTSRLKGIDFSNWDICEFCPSLLASG